VCIDVCMDLCVAGGCVCGLMCVWICVSQVELQEAVSRATVLASQTAALQEQLARCVSG